RKADRRVRAAADPPLQRLRGPGRASLRRDGPETVLLESGMPFSARRGPMPWLKPGILVGALAPLAAILMRARSGGLGANPIAEALNELGLVALALLIASLALTPLRTVFGWTWPIRVRRTVGLLAFFYATLHVSVYAGLDQAFDWRAIAADVSK